MNIYIISIYISILHTYLDRVVVTFDTATAGGGCCFNAAEEKPRKGNARATPTLVTESSVVVRDRGGGSVVPSDGGGAAAAAAGVLVKNRRMVVIYKCMGQKLCHSNVVCIYITIDRWTFNDINVYVVVVYTAVFLDAPLDLPSQRHSPILTRILFP